MTNVIENTTPALDNQVASIIDNAKKSGLTLIIGNKNYSSWSMRPWVLMSAFGIAFEELRIVLDTPTTTQQISQHSAAGRVPVLVHGNIKVWDSLSICEYIAEQFPDKHCWPQDVAARATARSVCAEMHSGFQALRTAMPMDIRANYDGKGRTTEAQADIGRISEIWEDCLAQYGHHQFLFGDFCIADAYFAPVVMRFKTYGVHLAPALQAYMERVINHPTVARWMREALQETEKLPDYY